ncbi:MAG: aminoglycoside phosphotransferase family protein, partial [Actinomycetia bacterium]|nr:aminoglycoside phosphotransferase family protein [Actinomycetes bacterium]
MTHVTDPVHTAITALRSDRVQVALGDAWVQWLGIEAEVETSVVWTAYRPHRKGRVILDLSCTEAGGEVRHQQMMFVANPPGAEPPPLAEDEFPPHVLPPVRAQPWNAIGWPVPYVPQPAGLVDLMRPETVAGLLGCPVDLIGELELIRLVPMRRSLIRTRVGQDTVFIKSYAKCSSFESGVAGLRAAATLPVSVPELLAVDGARSTFVMSGLPGVELSTLIDNQDEFDAALYATGLALAAVHNSEMRAGGNRLDTAETDDIVRLFVADLASIDPRLAGRIESLAMCLARQSQDLEPIAPRPLHGKCFGDQILWDSSTGLISMVDWDDATQGDPHFDLGRLIAHLVFLADELELEVELGSLLDGYCQGQGEICPARLRWHIAAA